MNDNMPKHSLRTTFNSTEPTRMPQRTPWVPPVRKDTTLQNLKKTFDTLRQDSDRIIIPFKDKEGKLF